MCMSDTQLVWAWGMRVESTWAKRLSEETRPSYRLKNLKEDCWTGGFGRKYTSEMLSVYILKTKQKENFQTQGWTTADISQPTSQLTIG